MRSRWLALLGLAVVALLASALVYIPRATIAVVAWRGGGTPSLLGAGLGFRLPFLQTVYRYPGGVVAAEGSVPASSREGTSVSIPYRAEARPSEQELLGLHQEGSGGGAVRALQVFVDEEVRKAAASAGTYDLASGSALDGMRTQVEKTLEGRFGPNVHLDLSPAALPPEVRATFSRESIYGRRRETGVSVVLVGLDGADWDVIDPMILRGELPNLARLKREGAWSTMRSNVPTLSPLLWTTVATGKGPDRHGINDFLVVDPKTGRQVPINSTFRKTKAIWSILTEARLSNDVIAWWATWPVEAINGHMISDRVSYSTWDVEGPAGSLGAVYPPDYAATVARLRVSQEAIGYRQVSEFIHVTEQEFRLARAAASRPIAPEDQESINVLVRVLASTETYSRIALDLLEARARSSTPARLFAVYFQGVDEMNHRFAHCAPPRAALCGAEDYRKFKDAIAAFYHYQDRILGEILRRAPGSIAIVISDHGFKSGNRRPRESKPFIEDKPGLWHDLSGVFIAAGPSIRKGEIPFTTLFDITPTILSLLGLPVPDDMSGKVLDAALSPQFLAANPVAKVPSYEDLPTLAAGRVAQAHTEPGGKARGSAGGEAGGAGRATGEALQTSADDEMVEQLRSLGYVAGGRGGAPARPAGLDDPGPPATGGVPTLLYHTNLGTVYLGKKQYDKAEAEFLKALAIDPKSGQALTKLAALYEVRGESEKALEELQILERIASPDEPAPLEKMADLFIRLGRAQDGLDFMRRLEARRGAQGDRREVGLRVAVGMLQAAAGRPDEAESSLLRALAIDPASASAMQEMFALYDAQGRAADLEPRIRAALAQAPRSSMHHNWLGLVLRRRGDLRGAETEFKRTLDLTPGLAGAMANLGSLYLQENRHAEAVAILKQALEKDPQSVESRTNLIVALGMTGDLSGARREVKEAESEGHKVPLYYNALAYALHVNGRNDEALAALRQSLTIDPRQPDALRLRSEIERGEPAGGAP